jgi:5-methyltetrahydrofolate--homocysteine methyltransferase
MPRGSLPELARERLVLLDGGIGTQLQLAGLPAGACGEVWNVERPDIVSGIHRAYAEAGAEALLTNTFGGSPLALARHGLGHRARELNRAAAALARDAAGDERWVLGDVGPFGGFLAPLGEAEPSEVEAGFREQVEALREGGADGVLIETMTALDELTLAVRAARAAGAPFVIASIAFDATLVGPRTMMGVSPRDAAAAALELGVDALGANCGTGLDMNGYAELLRELAAAAPALPLLCRPNAGTPRLEGGRVLYDLAPDRMAAAVGLLVAAGARMIGGCCGTTPAHIAALRAALAPSR